MFHNLVTDTIFTARNKTGVTAIDI